jgi:hypothetical protein
MSWALPPLEAVVMVNMTDLIINRTVRQLDGYGLHDYVRESYSRYLFSDGPSSLLGYCEVEFTAPMTVLRHPALSFKLQRALFKGYGLFYLRLLTPFLSACQHVSAGSDKLNKSCCN